MEMFESGVVFSRAHRETNSAVPTPTVPRTLHVLTLTPFYPSAENEAAGCFITEPLRTLEACGVRSTVIAAQPVHNSWKHSNTAAPSTWVRYPQIPGNLGLYGAGHFLFLRLLQKMKQIHRQHPIDLIHAHAALPCGQAAALLSATLGIHFVVTVHGLDVFNACFQDHGIAVRWRHEASVEVYRRAKRVICISEKVEKLILRSGEVRTSVIYNGTDTNLFPTFESSITTNTETILVVGTLQCNKGQDLVLRAIARLSNRHPQLRCRIIGEGVDQMRFATLAKELGIADRVAFLGRKTRAEVADEMRASTMFVLPSRYEALGCVYLEAMSSGKVAIGCTRQGIDEIIRHGENGWLVPVDGLDELTEGIEILLKSPELRMKIGMAARKTIVENLTLQHQAQRLARVYEEVAR